MADTLKHRLNYILFETHTPYDNENAEAMNILAQEFNKVLKSNSSAAQKFFTQSKEISIETLSSIWNKFIATMKKWITSKTQNNESIETLSEDTILKKAKSVLFKILKAVLQPPLYIIATFVDLMIVMVSGLGKPLLSALKTAGIAALGSTPLALTGAIGFGIDFALQFIGLSAFIFGAMHYLSEFGDQRTDMDQEHKYTRGWVTSAFDGFEKLMITSSPEN